jgi:glycolate dehydrogenase FAD-binding subunit
MIDDAGAERLVADCGEAIAATVAAAAASRKPLYISAGGSKRQLLGRACDAPTLDVSGHAGIVDYQPSELVLTARAGTPLPHILEALEREGQTLPFEPPLFGGKATLGGTLACNLSGPARPWAGSIRDLVLGVQLVNGLGETLNFGGKVMKNVAGYDVSRLQAGAQGTLGVLTEISLKVLPKPQHSISLGLEMDTQQAIETMNSRAAGPGPLSGACWLDGRLYLRLSGAAAAVEQTARLWGGQVLEDADTFWGELRDMNLPFFAGDQALWRFSVRPTAPAAMIAGPTLLDWGGAQRWLRGDHPLASLQQAAASGGGNVTLFRGGDRNAEVLPQPDPVSVRLQQRLKQSFDPAGVLNPGRLYGWMQE